MNLLDGKIVRIEVLKKIKEKLLTLDRPLGLVVIQIGNDPASNVYVKQKENMACELGFVFNHIRLDETVKEDKVLWLIDVLNRNEKIDGIIVQMPVPSHLNSKTIQNAVDPLKDIDGLTDINMGKLVHNVESLVPCTPEGIIELLEFYNIGIEGKNVTIIGRSDLVGKPLASLFTNKNATVTLCHSKTKNLKEFTKNADILVAALGIPNFVKEDYVKEGAVVIDVGISRLENGKLCGDVDFENVKEKVSYITPVPGGVGPMTVAMIAKNTYKAHVLKKYKRD